MEYLIGTYTMDVAIAPLIKSRIEKNHMAGMDVRDEGRFARVSASGREIILQLAGILTDIMVDNLQMHYIAALIQRRYFYLPKKERSGLLVGTLKKLWSRLDGNDWKRQYIKGKTAICLMESDVIMLDGIMRFRIKDETADWERCLFETERELAENAEHEEMIRMLRSYVTMKESLIGFVSVDPLNGGYVLHDSDGNEIAAPQDGDGCDSRAKDVVLAYLIRLSPASVDISNVSDKELKSVIAGVFAGRTKTKD